MEYIIDILYNPFIQFLTLRDIYNLLSVNSDLYNLFDNRGFLKNITYHYNNKYCEFIEKFEKHKDFIESIKLDNIENPLLWLPSVKKNLILHECHFKNSNYMWNGNFNNLKVLKLDKCHNTYQNIIDWKLLPNLQVLDIQYLTYNLSFDGINHCKSLNICCLNNANLNLDIACFNGLKNLEFFDN